MKKVYYNDNDIKNLTLQLIHNMGVDGFRPDIILTLTRGGLTTGTFLSHFYNVPLTVINKDYYIDMEIFQGYRGGNILIVDDINDTGLTFTTVFNQISIDLINAELEDITAYNFKFAALIDNQGSEFTVDYCGHEINKVSDPCWIVFPWENWWTSFGQSNTSRFL